jgi:hypothetical protein
VIFRGHPDIQALRNRIGKSGAGLSRSETRPTSVFFVPAGALLACIIKQPLGDVPPNCVATIKSDRIDGLDFHGPLAAAAGHAQHVALDFRQLSLSHPNIVGSAGILEKRIPIFSG